MPGWSFCLLHPGWIPRDLFAEQVLDNYVVDGHGERYQTKDRVRFEEPLKSMSACLWMVNTRELEKDELRTVSCARIPVNIAATQKLPAYLMLGMGFETKSGYCGVINQLEPVRRYCGITASTLFCRCAFCRCEFGSRRTRSLTPPRCEANAGALRAFPHPHPPHYSLPPHPT
jgi:hypothetical protein